MSYSYNLKIQNVNEKCERNCVVYTQVFENQTLVFYCVSGPGIEPARIAPLVFETSASTDSAIGIIASGQEKKSEEQDLVPNKK